MPCGRAAGRSQPGVSTWLREKLNRALPPSVSAHIRVVRWVTLPYLVLLQDTTLRCFLQGPAPRAVLAPT